MKNQVKNPNSNNSYFFVIHWSIFYQFPYASFTKEVDKQNQQYKTFKCNNPKSSIKTLPLILKLYCFRKHNRPAALSLCVIYQISNLSNTDISNIQSWEQKRDTTGLLCFVLFVAATGLGCLFILVKNLGI